MEKITELMFDKMAKQIDNPFLYIMATIDMGFKALSDKQDIVKAWNRHHPDKRLPKPRKEGQP